MASVTIRNLSEETKALLAQRASRRRHSLEEELRQILDEAARAEAGNPDALEPLGSFIVRITRPGYADVARRDRCAAPAP
jgi:hypothetical protein